MSEWRVVHNFPDYAVSDLGEVKRINAGPTRKAGTTLRLDRHRSGHLYVRLYNGSARPVKRGVHQLVCEAWHGPKPDHCRDVRHLDGAAANNTPANLCWGTQKDNAEDRVKHGVQVKGETNKGGGKLTEVQAIAIKSAHTDLSHAAVARDIRHHRCDGRIHTQRPRLEAYLGAVVTIGHVRGVQQPHRIPALVHDQRAVASGAGKGAG